MDGKKRWKMPVTKHKFSFISLLYRLYLTRRVHRIVYSNSPNVNVNFESSVYPYPKTVGS